MLARRLGGGRPLGRNLVRRRPFLVSLIALFILGLGSGILFAQEPLPNTVLDPNLADFHSDNSWMFMALHFEPGRMANGRAPCGADDIENKGHCYPTNGYAGPTVEDGGGTRTPSTEWPEQYWPELEAIIDRADQGEHHLTLYFQAQWAQWALIDPDNDCRATSIEASEECDATNQRDAICNNTAEPWGGRLNQVRCWIDTGHEIAIHQHTLHTLCDPHGDSDSPFQGDCELYGGAATYPPEVVTRWGNLDLVMQTNKNQYHAGRIWSGYTNLPDLKPLPWLIDRSTGQYFISQNAPLRTQSYMVPPVGEFNTFDIIDDPQAADAGWSETAYWAPVSDEQDYIGDMGDHYDLINRLVDRTVPGPSTQMMVETGAIGPSWEAVENKYGGSFVDWPNENLIYSTNDPYRGLGQPEEYGALADPVQVNDCNRYNDHIYNRGRYRAWTLGHRSIAEQWRLGPPDHAQTLYGMMDDASAGSVIGSVMHVFNYHDDGTESGNGIGPAAGKDYQGTFNAVLGFLEDEEITLRTVRDIQANKLGHIAAPTSGDNCFNESLNGQ